MVIKHYEQTQLIGISSNKILLVLMKKIQDASINRVIKLG